MAIGGVQKSNHLVAGSTRQYLLSRALAALLPPACALGAARYPLPAARYLPRYSLFLGNVVFWMQGAAADNATVYSMGGRDLNLTTINTHYCASYLLYDTYSTAIP